MNLAQLIEAQKPQAGSLRDMADRATAAGYPISHASISAYATGKVVEVPSEATRLALAAALDVPVDVVTAAAFETAAPGLRSSWPDGFAHGKLFVHLTDGRSNAEIRQVLGVVRAALSAMDVASDHATRAESGDSYVTGERPDTNSGPERR